MSQSSASWNGDIGTRYERLATEHSKLLAQAKLLKKGVLDERAKNEQLTEELQSAEIGMRRLKTENESLQFRNDQLLKRIQTLQEELEQQQRGKGKKKENKKERGTERENQLETSIAVLEEELRNKMEQNKRLAMRLDESDKLNDALYKEVRELKQLIAEMDNNPKGLPPRPNKLVPPNNNNCSSPRAGSPSPSSQSSSVASSIESPFWHAADAGRALLAGTSTLLSLVEQRVRIYPYDAALERVPPHITKLGDDLSEASKQLAAAVDEVAKIFDSPAEQWQHLAASACDSVADSLLFATAKLPSQLEVLSREESNCSWSDGTLEALNERWRNSLTSLLREFSSAISQVKDAVANLDKESILKVSRLASSFHAVVKGTQESFSARWLVETRLPVQTKKGKCVGTATRDCLLKMVSESAKANAKLTAVATEWEKEREEREREERARKEDERRQAEESLRSECEEADTDCAEEKPASLEERRKTGKCAKEEKAHHGDSSWKTHAELECARTRVRELEGEREKLLLDLALLKRKVSHLATTPSAASSVAAIADKRDSNKVIEEATESVVVETERHYLERLRETAERLLRAEARGNYYSRECEILVRSGRAVAEERRRAEECADSLKMQTEQLADELKMTRSGYESKLREMTEHVAEMNAERTEKERAAATTPATGKNTLGRRLALFK